jgi:nicotinamide riboside kinase
MKVALIGTHGVGKTTLCFELAARLKRRDVNVEMVREVARRCPLPINRETSKASQAWILHTQMAWEIEAEANHQLVVCDRSVLDNYCYLVHAVGHQPNWETLLTAWLGTYDLLVKVPLWSSPRWDGVRDTDLAFQRAIDVLIDQELARSEVAVLRLAPDDRERWAEIVMVHLEPVLRPQPLLFPEDETASIDPAK